MYVTAIPSNQLCDPQLRAIHDGIADVSIEGDTIETEARSEDSQMDELMLIGAENQFSTKWKKK